MWNNTDRSQNSDTTRIWFFRCMRLLMALWMILTWGGLAACAGDVPSAAPTPTSPPLAEELIFYNWGDYMPHSVLDAFTAEYGVRVTYLTYGSMEEAMSQLRANQRYDVAVLEHDLILPLVAENLLAEIDYRNVPNFKNISIDFRDLAFDPGNKYTIPYGYGTTGLVVRGDLATVPVTRWADLWEPRYAGKIAVRAEPGELIGVALKALGYPLNSEDPQHLEAALQHLLDLKPSIVFVGDETAKAIQTLLNGEVVIMIGWGNDALQARQQNDAITYVLPTEGTMLWSDTFVISANSPHKPTAELLLNFLLRPEIGAQIINGIGYATANEAAYPFVQPEILNNPFIFPPAETIKKADWYLPLSPAGEKLYADIWQRFLAGRP
jgi:spermidine/putrescine transport system substrate-binding protein